MKKSVKTLSIITISFLFLSSSRAQLKFASQHSSIGNDIKKVLAEYPACFAGIRGDIILQNPQTTEYECNFKADGSEESSITIYTANKKEICSWQALMLTTGDFNEAKKKYRLLYSQLNIQPLSLGNLNSLPLKGSYDEPKEEKKFASSILSFNTSDMALKKLKVEILLQYEPMEWKVKVLVYDREREDHERGKIKDD